MIPERFYIKSYHYLYFAIYDNKAKDYVRSNEGKVLTRDTIKSTDNLLASIKARVGGR